MNALTVATPPALPARRSLRGPVTRRLLWRNLVVLGAPWAAGVGLAAFTSSGWLEAFGLGLAFPGGGFLATGDPVLAGVFVLGFLLSMMIWIVIGAAVAPPLEWLTAAGLAALIAGDQPTWPWAIAVVPWLVPLTVVLVLGYQRLTVARTWREAELSNHVIASLADSNSALLTAAATPTSASWVVGELNEDDLKFQRYLLNLSLQPYDSFEGFDRLDQFREGAYRYQLNFIGYALSISTATRTPAFSGYLAEAQRRVIEKFTHPKVWSYWFLENLWGNLDRNRDPVCRDNIMLTGYLGTQIAAYESVTNDERFSQPGALTFKHRNRSMPYDWHSIAQRVDEQLWASAYGLIPCEPNWAWSGCNSIGFCGLVGHDARYGSTHAARNVERFRQSLETEFTTPAGRSLILRSSRLGFAFPGMTTSQNMDVNMAYWLNPTLPDLAARFWALARHQQVTIDAEGRATLAGNGLLERIDAGNYKIGWGASAYNILAGTAGEMGDEELRTACRARIDYHDPLITHDGVARHKASVNTNALAYAARVGERGTWRAILNEELPKHWHSGPRLGSAQYPDVLVARAVTDGRDLSLVLRPGEGSVRTELGVERLVPNASYRVTGGGGEEDVTADAAGAAQFSVNLDGRTEIHVVPLV